MELLGIDVGGSSIKAALVDVAAGHVIGEVASHPTPNPSTPDAVMQAVAVLGRQLPSTGPVGFAFPSVVKQSKARTAAHVDEAWVDADGVALIQRTLGRPCAFLNDADAAGIAEMSCGAGRDTPGTVIMLTFGTGIGTALFADGQLFPNTEFGHLPIHGVDAEEWASARIRTLLNLDWPAWIDRVNEYLDVIYAALLARRLHSRRRRQRAFRRFRAAAALSGRNTARALRGAGRRHGSCHRRIAPAVSSLP